MSRPRPVRILAGVGAAATAVTGGLILIPGIPGWIPPTFAVLGLGLTVFVGKYTEDQVTPLTDPRDEAGRKLVPMRNGGPINDPKPYLIGEAGSEYVSKDGVPPTDPTSTPGD